MIQKCAKSLPFLQIKHVFVYLMHTQAYMYRFVAYVIAIDMEIFREWNFLTNLLLFDASMVAR